MTTFFELRDVGFSVPGRDLVTDIDLSIAAGRVTALIGHNGSGKSTLVKLLGRHLTPSRGSLACNGVELARWSNRDYARKIAYMAQTTPLTGGMTVHELVALGRYPWLGALGRPGPIDRDHVEKAIEATDLSLLSERLVDTLSGGERQRAWLSMMLAQAPECLLLDEPIAALDVAHQLTVMRMVRRLSREHGLTVVIVLHDVNMAARFCDDIVALKGGRIVFEGLPGHVLQPQTLEDIYGTRFKIARSEDYTGSFAVPVG